MIQYSHASDEGNNIKKNEDAVMESFYRGDYKSLYQALRDMLMSYPAHPVSLLYYHDLSRFADIVGLRNINADLRNLKDKISHEKDAAVRNICTLLLDLELEKLLYAKEPYQAKKFTDALSPVRKWLVQGPYFKYGAGDLQNPFMPEIEEAAAAREKSRSVTIKDFDSVLRLDDYLYPVKGVAYASASFKTGVPVKIRIHSRSYYRAFINGKEVCENTVRNFQNVRIIKVWDTDRITLMIKADLSQSKGVRVIVTDYNNSVLSLNTTIDDSYRDPFRYSEDYDFPYHVFSETPEPGKGTDSTPAGLESLRHLGMYFSGLDSRKSVFYYRKSLAEGYNKFTEYLLGSTLVEESESDSSSADQMDGWRILNELVKKDRGFIPVRLKKFQELVSRNDYENAFAEGERIISLSPNNVPAYVDFLDLMGTLGYEKEFEAYCGRFARAFPFSVFPLTVRAEYQKKRKSPEYFAQCEKILNEKFIKKYADDLLKAYISREDFDKALGLIGRYGHGNEYNDRLAEIYIQKRDFKKARDLIFKSIAAGEKPSFYFNLGLIDNIENSDPLLYWEKMLSLNPSLFNFSDYLKFLGSRKVDNPFDKYLDDPDPADAALKFIKKGIQDQKNDAGSPPSEILFRGRYFLLNSDRSSRVYCEDIIYLHDQEGADKWGEYRVPYRGGFQPLRIRTYHDDAGFSDSYSIKEINDEHYISLNSLRKGSIVQVSYIIDNPVNTPKDSMFFSLPFELLQNYDEPVKRILIKVISPEDMSLNFKLRDGWEVRKENSENKKIYTISSGGLKAVHREKLSGSDLNSLPYFSFSTMGSYSDFQGWYRGLVYGRDFMTMPDEIKFLKKENVDKTVRSVYDYVSRNIGLLGNVLYYPEDADDTLYRKTGTAEDKVILAKSILNELGIKSYISFSKKRDMPDFGNFISPDVFTNILLYVPVDMSRKYWLDFSDQHYMCGTVDPGLLNADSIVFMNGGYQLIRIQGTEDNIKTGEYTLRIDKNGDAKINGTNNFYGSFGNMRKYFSNKQYYDEIISSYYGEFLPGLDINSYKIEHKDDFNNPFRIIVEGDSIGLALSGSNKLIIEPVFKKNSIYNYMIYSSRVHRLFIMKPADEKETYHYILPEEYKNAVLEKKYHRESIFGKVDIAFYKKKGNSDLLVTKDIKFLKTIIDPGEYGEFLEFCINLKNIEFMSVVFRQE